MKTLHQIWLGDKNFSSDWVDSWKSLNPGMSYKLWTEADIEEFGLINQIKYDRFMMKQMYDGAADIARVEILERLGGVYTDIDSICLLPFQDAWFIDSDFFAGFEYDRRVGNGVIGCVPHHPIMRDYIKRISEATIIEPPCYTIGGTLLTSCIDSYTPNDDEVVIILPQRTFYPKLKNWETYKDDEVYCRQLFAGTKGLYEKL